MVWRMDGSSADESSGASAPHWQPIRPVFPTLTHPIGRQCVPKKLSARRSQLFSCQSQYLFPLSFLLNTFLFGACICAVSVVTNTIPNMIEVFPLGATFSWPIIGKSNFSLAHRYNIGIAPSNLRRRILKTGLCLAAIAFDKSRQTENYSRI